MFSYGTLYMEIIKQFTEELAIYFQYCMSAPYLFTVLHVLSNGLY